MEKMTCDDYFSAVLELFYGPKGRKLDGSILVHQHRQECRSCNEITNLIIGNFRLRRHQLERREAVV